MLRAIFVAALILIGIVAAAHGPFGALLFYLWFAYFRPEAWLWTDFVSALNLSYVLGIYLLVRVALSAERPFFLNLRTVLLAALTVHSLLSTLLSAHTDYSFHYWRDFAKSTIITYTIAALLVNTDRFRTTLLVISLSLGFEAAKQGWAQFFLNPGASNTNSVPFLGDNNAVAVGMFMLVPLLLALGSTARGRAEKVLHRFFAVGVAYRGLATYSRGGFLACGTLVAAYALRSQHKLRVILGIALVAAILLPVMPDAFWDRMGTITPAEEEMDTSAAGRVHFWRVAVKMANAHPILGVGHNAYNPAYDDYDFRGGAFGTQRSVHSAWFGVLSELGYVGLALFCTNIALAFLACVRVRRLAARGQISPELGRYAVAIEASLAAFAIGGAFVIFQYTEMLWHVIGLSIALDRMASKEAAAYVETHAAAAHRGHNATRPVAPRLPSQATKQAR